MWISNGLTVQCIVVPFLVNNKRVLARCACAILLRGAVGIVIVQCGVSVSIRNRSCTQDKLKHKKSYLKKPWCL
jgi:hypothetical protein